MTICKPRHWNLGIGIGIGTDTRSTISSIRPMDTKPSRLTSRPIDTKPSRLTSRPTDTKPSRGDEGTPPTKSRDTSISWSRDKYKTLYFHFHKAYVTQTYQGGDLG